MLRPAGVPTGESQLAVSIRLVVGPDDEGVCFVADGVHRRSVISARRPIADPWRSCRGKNQSGIEYGERRHFCGRR